MTKLKKDTTIINGKFGQVRAVHLVSGNDWSETSDVKGAGGADADQDEACAEYGTARQLISQSVGHLICQ